jgi:hypothetical protein
MSHQMKPEAKAFQEQFKREFAEFMQKWGASITVREEYSGYERYTDGFDVEFDHGMVTDSEGYFAWVPDVEYGKYEDFKD